MQRFLAFFFAVVVVCASPLGWAAPSRVPDAVVHDSGGARVRLSDAVAGQRTILIFIDPAWAEARSWLTRTLSDVPASVLDETVVVLTRPRAFEQTVDIGLSGFPGVRVFLDKDALILKSGAIKMLPTVLGASADGVLKSQLSGAMATSLDLNAFGRQLHTLAARTPVTR